MTTIVVSVKTLTEVEKESNTFLISCMSDKNENGTTTPSIFKSQVLKTPKIVDNVSGKEGELMLSHSGETVGNLNEDGSLTIELEDDNADRYSKQNENLIYNEG